MHRPGLAPGQLLQDQQALRQGQAASRGRRRADQFATLGQGHAHGLPFDDAVLGQIAQGPDAAGGTHASDQLVGDLAGVEAGVAIAGQAFQGGGQFRLA
ncbi:hypothetical protein D3C71_1999930 [compost metagenome]